MRFWTLTPCQISHLVEVAVDQGAVLASQALALAFLREESFLGLAASQAMLYSLVYLMTQSSSASPAACHQTPLDASSARRV